MFKIVKQGAKPIVNSFAVGDNDIMPPLYLQSDIQDINEDWRPENITPCNFCHVISCDHSDETVFMCGRNDVAVKYLEACLEALEKL
jgi:hypothetical protein